MSAVPHARLDQMLGAVATLLNRLLQFDPDTRARLTALAGKVIRLEVNDGNAPPRRLYLVFTADAVQLVSAHDHPDVTISGPPGTFLRRIFSATGVPVAGELQIRGDIELGQRFQQLLAGQGGDAEEMLARVVGDVAARQGANAARALFGWMRYAGDTLARDVSEYAREEAFIVAPRERVAAFVRAVDALRADADRLEQRWRRVSGQR